MPTVYINDEPLEIAADEQLNGIEAARRVGVEIPHYCWHPALSVVAGRPLCDTYLAARELVREGDYTLPMLARGLLKQGRTEGAPADIPGGGGGGAAPLHFGGVDGAGEPVACAGATRGGYRPEFCIARIAGLNRAGGACV